MVTMQAAAEEFLAGTRVAVTGVSRTAQGHGGNVVYQRLRERGQQVYPINPNAAEIDGQPCYPDLASVPGGLDAVVIATRPEIAGTTMRECVELGVKQVWMHRSFGAGSVDPDAARYGRAHGIRVIEGGCPLMYGAVSDGSHRLMCTVLRLFGKVPREV